MKPLMDKHGEVRELTEADFATMVPFSALPASLQSKLTSLSKRGRPKSSAPKTMMSFRLPPDVIASIKASGDGYGLRVEAVLREAITEGRI